MKSQICPLYFLKMTNVGHIIPWGISRSEILSKSSVWLNKLQVGNMNFIQITNGWTFSKKQ